MAQADGASCVVDLPLYLRVRVTMAVHLLTCSLFLPLSHFPHACCPHAALSALVNGAAPQSRLPARLPSAQAAARGPNLRLHPQHPNNNAKRRSDGIQQQRCGLAGCTKSCATLVHAAPADLPPHPGPRRAEPPQVQPLVPQLPTAAAVHANQKQYEREQRQAARRQAAAAAAAAAQAQAGAGQPSVHAFPAMSSASSRMAMNGLLTRRTSGYSRSTNASQTSERVSHASEAEFRPRWR